VALTTQQINNVTAALSEAVSLAGTQVSGLDLDGLDTAASAADVRRDATAAVDWTSLPQTTRDALGQDGAVAIYAAVEYAKRIAGNPALKTIYEYFLKNYQAV
jgi:hypothetical protein